MPVPDIEARPTPEQGEKLLALQHMVQSGIAALQGHHDLYGSRFPQVEPKHLRVGVNSAMVEASATARILFAKGICTPREFFDQLIAVWNEEVDSYEKLLCETIGPQVRLRGGE